MSLPDGPLAVCDTCEMIGTSVEALAHWSSTGHSVRRLDAKTADEVRSRWREDRIKRVAALVEYARMRPGADDQ